ncbi:MAG: hypothetical protein AB7G11_02540 [Phycisphaerales bacterium]
MSIVNARAQRLALQSLIAEQSQDDQTWKLPDERFGKRRDGRVFKATDIGDRGEGWSYLADAIDESEPTELVGSTRIWGAAEVAYEPRRGPCPVCRDGIESGEVFCLVCSAWGRNRRQWPAMVRPKVKMKRPGKASKGKRRDQPNETRADGVLKGGTGR